MKGNEIEKQLSKLFSDINIEVPKVEINFGSRYIVEQAASTIDTRDVLRICNKFCDSVGKENIQVEISNTGKTLPEMNPKIPYIVIESSYKGILRAKKKLDMRNYTQMLKDDFVESDNLALMIFRILE